MVVIQPSSGPVLSFAPKRTRRPKPVWNFGSEGLEAFDSVYVGISVARVSV
jgi:hypothetical protein